MPKITEMFAFIIADKDENDEGVPSIQTALGHMPLVGADAARIGSLRPYAQYIASDLKRPVRLVRFLQMEEVEVLMPITGEETPE